jgi:hypothetical protein
MSERGVRLPPRRRRRPGAARADQPGDVLRCLLLARGPEWVAVDVATGALVRSRASGWPAAASDSEPDASPTEGDAHPGRPYPAHALDLVEIELAGDDEPPDPSRPEAVMVRRSPLRVGAPRRRAVRRLLQDLLPANSKRPLLGSLGPSISYEDLDGSRPSVAVIAPDRAPIFTFDAKGTWCQFSLGGRRHHLPVVDERLLEAGTRARGGALDVGAVTRAVGGVPKYLIVGLGAPRRGQAPKLVLGVLPRP